MARKRPLTITFRVSEEERRRAEKIAIAQGISVSSFLVRILNRYSEEINIS